MEDDDHCPPDDPPSRRDVFFEGIQIPPPMYPEDTDPPPGSILLHPTGYISDRTNSTTASGFTKAGKGIQATFWVAHPPRASYFSIHSPDVEIADSPTIVTTEKDVALLRVPICRGCNFNPRDSDYFLYEAGTKLKRPTLRLVAMPFGISFADCNVGLLRFRTRRKFLIAILSRTSTTGQHDLHLYSSKTKSWSKRLMHVDSPEAAKDYKYASKVIPIGGERGSVAWVDLWNGILICDLLLDNQSLRYIPLPSPRVPNLIKGGPPLRFRDIALLGGYIRYFEMCVYFGQDLEIIGWEGAASMMKFSCKETEWEECCRIKVCNDPAASGVPPNLQKGSVLRKPVLKGLYPGFPAISLHEDDVVYVMVDKQSVADKKASVVAVDMKKQTVKSEADFVCGLVLGYSEVYITSGISRYLGLWSSTSQKNGDKTSKNGIAKGKQVVSGGIANGKQAVSGDGVQSHLD